MIFKTRKAFLNVVTELKGKQGVEKWGWSNTGNESRIRTKIKGKFFQSDGC